MKHVTTRTKFFEECCKYALNTYTLPRIKGSHFSFLFNTKSYKIISIGRNNETQHPHQKVWGYPRHAGEHSEFAALRKINFKLPDNTGLLNLRVDRNGNLNYAAPCKYCARVLSHIGLIRPIYFTDTQGHIVILQTVFT